MNWSVARAFGSRMEADGRPDTTSNRILGLDGLRAISITLVMLAHFVTQNIPGGLGVYIFFVISGFLITNIILGEENFSFLRFYARRILRLFPVIIVYVSAVILIFKISGQEINWIEPISALSYFANYYYSSNGPVTMPFVIFWSLSVEEHFYIILPVLIWILAFNPRKLLLAMAVVVAGCLALRIASALRHPELVGTQYFYFRSQYRLDSLAFGVALACMHRLGVRLRSLAWIGTGLGLILFGLVLRDEFFRQTVRYTILGVGISCSLGWILTRGKTVLDHPLAVWIGGLSYSLYVWHLLAPRIAEWLSPTAPVPVKIVEYLCFSLALAVVSYYGIERPFFSLRSRLHHGRAPSTAAALFPRHTGFDELDAPHETARGT